jgi:hypothetical protein
MKIKITVKDPDGFYDAIHDAVSLDVDEMGLSDGEKDVLINLRIKEQMEKLEKWVEYDESLTVEFDTENMTAIVEEQ